MKMSIHEQTMFEMKRDLKNQVFKSMQVNPISKGTTWRNKEKSRTLTYSIMSWKINVRELTINAQTKFEMNATWRIKSWKISMHAKPISKGKTWTNKDKQETTYSEHHVLKINGRDLKNQCNWNKGPDLKNQVLSTKTLTWKIMNQPNTKDNKWTSLKNEATQKSWPTRCRLARCRAVWRSSRNAYLWPKFPKYKCR